MGLNRLGQMSLLAIEADILDSITNSDVSDYCKVSKFCKSFEYFRNNNRNFK